MPNLTQLRPFQALIAWSTRVEVEVRTIPKKINFCIEKCAFLIHKRWKLPMKYWKVFQTKIEKCYGTSKFVSKFSFFSEEHVLLSNLSIRGLCKIMMRLVICAVLMF